MRRIKTIETASSMKNVPFGSRKIPAVVMVTWSPGLLRQWATYVSPSGGDALRGEHVDEHDHEEQVDEVHGLHQAHGQEEVLTRFGLDLGLSRNGGDRLRPGQAVANRGTDGTATEGQSAADERPGDPNRSFCCSCHVLSPFSRSVEVEKSGVRFGASASSEPACPRADLVRLATHAH